MAESRAECGARGKTRENYGGTRTPRITLVTRGRERSYRIMKNRYNPSSRELRVAPPSRGFVSAARAGERHRALGPGRPRSRVSLLPDFPANRICRRVSALRPAELRSNRRGGSQPRKGPFAPRVPSAFLSSPPGMRTTNLVHEYRCNGVRTKEADHRSEGGRDGDVETTHVTTLPRVSRFPREFRDSRFRTLGSARLGGPREPLRNANDDEPLTRSSPPSSGDRRFETFVRSPSSARGDRAVRNSGEGGGAPRFRR